MRQARNARLPFDGRPFLAVPTVRQVLPVSDSGSVIATKRRPVVLVGLFLCGGRNCQEKQKDSNAGFHSHAPFREKQRNTEQTEMKIENAFPSISLFPFVPYFLSTSHP
jgi:hypothetical protein